MTRRRRRVTVLVAGGDAEGRRLMGEALAARRPDCDLRFAGGGEELTDYLCRRGPYRGPAHPPRPGLLVLDWRLVHPESDDAGGDGGGHQGPRQVLAGRRRAARRGQGGRR